jgi:hypothetical protein
VPWRKFLVLLATMVAAALTVHFLVWDWTNTSRLLGQLTGFALITAANAAVINFRSLGQRSERLAIGQGSTRTRDDEADGMLARVKAERSDGPYRAAPPTPPDPYRPVWAKLRGRWRVGDLVTIVGTVCLVASMFVAHSQLHLLGLAVALSLLNSAIHVLVSRSPCPTCGRAFIGSGRSLRKT